MTVYGTALGYLARAVAQVLILAQVYSIAETINILSEISTENQLIIQTANIRVLYYYYLKIAVL